MIPTESLGIVICTSKTRAFEFIRLHASGLFHWLSSIAYYLMDDEMEVLDVHEPNDGKERFPALFRKGPLPKKVMVIDSRSRDIEDDCGDDDYYQ